jgi:hypothetical protein
MTEDDDLQINLPKHSQNTGIRKKLKVVNVLNYKECAVKSVSKKLHLDCSEHKSKHRIRRNRKQHVVVQF